MSIHVQQKTYNKPSLPPLSSLLKENAYKFPPMDFKPHLVLTSSIGSTVASSSSSAAPTPVMTPLSMSAPSLKTAFPPSKPMVSPTSPKSKKRKEEKSFAFISHSVKTFPSQEPSIDNAPLARRKRRRTSPNELNILNQEFLLGSTPNKMRRIEIAKKVSMTEKAVQIWFQNKRQSVRKQSINDREITELPPTPDASVNSSMSNLLNNSAVGSAVSSVNTSMVVSTPIKPGLQKSQSFSSPDNRLGETPIPNRSYSTGSVLQTHATSSTPNSSFIDDSITDQSFVLQETKKKQPVMLNNSNSSTMTFKLGKFKVHNDKENVAKPNKIQNLLNSVADDTSRTPLGEISANKAPKVSKSANGAPRLNEGVQSLLSLKGGNWK